MPGGRPTGACSSCTDPRSSAPAADARPGAGDRARGPGRSTACRSVANSRSCWRSFSSACCTAARISPTGARPAPLSARPPGGRPRAPPRPARGRTRRPPWRAPSRQAPRPRRRSRRRAASADRRTGTGRRPTTAGRIAAARAAGRARAGSSPPRTAAPPELPLGLLGAAAFDRVAHYPLQQEPIDLALDQVVLCARRRPLPHPGARRRSRSGPPRRAQAVLLQPPHALQAARVGQLQVEQHAAHPRQHRPASASDRARTRVNGAPASSSSSSTSSASPSSSSMSRTRMRSGARRDRRCRRELTLLCHHLNLLVVFAPGAGNDQTRASIELISGRWPTPIQHGRIWPYRCSDQRGAAVSGKVITRSCGARRNQTFAAARSSAGSRCRAVEFRWPERP